jgi:hypothetical protein
MSEFDSAPVLSEDDDAVAVRPPVVDGKAEDRLNPPSEYEVLDLSGLAPEALKARLNALGEEGWALVAASPAFIFRRMKKVDPLKPKGRVGFGLV